MFASECCCRNEEQLNRKCRVTGSLLRTHTIRIKLLINLGKQRAPAILAQSDCTGKSWRHDRAHNQARKLGDPMIVGGRVERWKSSNPIDMRKEEAKRSPACDTVEAINPDDGERHCD
ncbi:hypothetical protein BDS110ZK12_27640 [Bradyrhizobium diazoefficiens]|uniref:Uncharacterized protein n=1 Tax=Bradyrhizobium diazoefficiens TaxID=1355477 RepID=A0A810BLW9_9BRAD|nr:hypothetical protein XF8B_65910 [Bradyrhizobium diazoefficiens]BCF37578.1 hypothetical protein XF15B_66490 [Bradyrhizobium diazoefficiens]BCF46256.1 hypothetical protein XF16B_67460 [Bradyrhizobium diazoefficiens]BCF72409.1 hypothetical protein XF19B_67620 [Bradyrhizobium diazoefficiens]